MGLRNRTWGCQIMCNCWQALLTDLKLAGRSQEGEKKQENVRDKKYLISKYLEEYFCDATFFVRRMVFEMN